jgi:hypothetical protein
MRARRPERFSDSAVADKSTLDRSMLEYHLHSVTSRSQEAAFATFARLLAEREICPNLLPQTGPTGGGDSKVDSETYPVAEELALGWHVGAGSNASSERWGFAFSAKKKWQEKVTSDVNSAMSTRRGYLKIFFISNQAIRDKARAKSEDELSQAHGIDVRILDRTWILDKVFSNGHEALAIEHLGVATSIRRQDVRRGPRDTQRELELQKLEDRVQKAIVDGCQGLQLAEDCIETAELTKSLERSRTEIDGHYERAEQMAAKYGTTHQRVKAAYQRAWTTFWWFEEYERFSELYGLVENRVRGSENVYEFELLTNLWTLLQASVTRGQLARGRSSLRKRTESLVKELERLRKIEGQPSAALHARTLQLLVKLSASASSGQQLEALLGEFREVVEQCQDLAGFPWQPLIAILTELGDLLGGLSAYDELFEAAVAHQAERKGEVEAARMKLARGIQLLNADRPYEAIRTLGSCLRGLNKEESRDDAIRALYLCGCAYERVGLLWAARGTLLAAASLSTSDLWNHSHASRAQTACFRRVKWLELQLGRIPHALSWHEIDCAIRTLLSEREGPLPDSQEEDVAFDGCLAILLLKADHWDSRRLEELPDVLDRLELFNAWAALLYVLGYEQELPGDFMPSGSTKDDLHTSFLRWRDQLASKELPQRPTLYDEQRITLTSLIIGCRVSINSENQSPCVELAESILAALESLLSTGTLQSMAVREPAITMSIKKSDFAQDPFEFELTEETGRPHINILCGPFNPHKMSREFQSKFRDNLLRLVSTIFARVVIANNYQELFKKLAQEELALDRSIGFTGSFITIGNVLGDKPKNRISDWSDERNHRFPTKLSRAWDADDPAPERQDEAAPRPISFGKGDPPRTLLDRGRVKQGEIRTLSLIRETLWDKAKWQGVFFAVEADNRVPPTFGLMFADLEAAKSIFKFLSSDLGANDPKDQLRISIVRGINRKNPNTYRVLIGSNLTPELRKQGVRYFTSVSRMKTMEPEFTFNIDMFLASYDRVKTYSLAPAFVNGPTSIPTIIDCPHFVKRNLSVREAWQIGRHDPDSVAIFSDDDPIIPSGEKVIPVKELLEFKMRQQRDSDS